MFLQIRLLLYLHLLLVLDYLVLLLDEFVGEQSPVVREIPILVQLHFTAIHVCLVIFLLPQMADD